MAASQVMDRATCQKLFRFGALKAAVVIQFPMSDLWAMQVERNDGGREQLTIARTEEPKLYVTLGAALTDAGRIGFKEVRVQVPEKH